MPSHEHRPESRAWPYVIEARYRRKPLLRFIPRWTPWRLHYAFRVALDRDELLDQLRQHNDGRAQYRAVDFTPMPPPRSGYPRVAMRHSARLGIMLLASAAGFAGVGLTSSLMASEKASLQQEARPRWNKAANLSGFGHARPTYRYRADRSITVAAQKRISRKRRNIARHKARPRR